MSNLVPVAVRARTSGSNMSRFELQASDAVGSVQAWADTQIETETFAFFWNLRNCSLWSSSNQQIRSPVFRGGPKGNHSWQLKVYSKEVLEEKERYLCVFLFLTDFGDASRTEKIKARYQITIVDDQGRAKKQAGSSTMPALEFGKQGGSGYEKFISIKELLSSDRGILKDDTLKLHCRVWVEGDLKHVVGSGDMQDEAGLTERGIRILSDISKLYKDTALADVEIITKTNSHLAHKVILAAQSSVFLALFNAGNTYEGHFIVEIPDFVDEVVMGMLEYIYTGKTERMEGWAPELLQIAEKYSLPGLKRDCEDIILNHVSVDNAAEILVLAHHFHSNRLKTMLIDFINQRKDDVKQTEAFKRIAKAHPEVFVLLYLSQ